MDRNDLLKIIEQQDVIILRNVYGKQAGSVEIRPTFDSKKNKFIGIPILSKKQEEEEGFFLNKESSIVLSDGHEFFIHNEDGVDLAYWEMIKVNPAIALSFEEAQRRPEAVFYVEIPELESKKEIDNESLVHEAIGYILDDSLDNLVFRARLLGVNMEGDSASTIKKYLISRAKRNPQEITAIYNSNLASVKLLFYSCLDKNIILHDKKTDIYNYGTQILGVGEAASLTYLQHKDNKMLLAKLSEDYEKTSNSKFFSQTGQAVENEELFSKKLVELKAMAEELGVPKELYQPCVSKDCVIKQILLKQNIKE